VADGIGRVADYLDAPLNGSVVPIGPGARFGAFVLDIVLMAVTLGIGWLIWSMFTWRHGQSPAKRMLKQQVVVVATGMPATWGRMALREIVGKWLLSTLTRGVTSVVGAVLIFGPKRQALWDFVAGTTVVQRVG
jgi:uncharacterized RDD family membrane protein YckC